MPFPYDGTGVKIDQGPKLIPEGDYVLRIIKAEAGVTKKGDNGVAVDFEIADGDFKFEKIRYHYVTFFKDRESKAAGMAIHFLKCIGEPWEGAFEVDELNWIGKMVLGHVSPEMSNYGKSKGKIFPKVKWVEKLDATAPGQEEVPF